MTCLMDADKAFLDDILDALQVAQAPAHITLDDRRKGFEQPAVCLFIALLGQLHQAGQYLFVLLLKAAHC